MKPGQAERLAYLTEELGEALQVVGKVLRHGYDSVDPTASTGATNKEALENELADVVTAIELLARTDDLDGRRIMDNGLRKAEMILNRPEQYYMHHQ